MRVIGLTGGIASGKSTVAQMLARRGAVVVDGDQVAREVVKPGTPAHAELVAAFGPDILWPDGSINRRRLATLVFEDARARKVLDDITHPRLRQRVSEILDGLRREGARVVVYAGALLLEAGLEGLVDEVWVVSVDPDTQLQRLMARDGLSREQALARMRAQASLKEKAARAAVVIDNGGEPHDTERQVQAAWEEFLRRLPQETPVPRADTP
ncbi:MAG: dephospho-CoA kinase [Syntrophomonadaceae bacterium]|jgi:dephospho-CoA kinase|nr:dephospho-CoA kinase [Syntrophomonadaceae bacterium]MDH7497729.1 dephospho-CoA kinase [Syntrophomonadaceae bacterium]